MLAAGALVFGLVSCEEPQTEANVVEAAKAQEPAPLALAPKRVRTRQIRPEAYRFLAAITEMDGQIDDLEALLADIQALHDEYDFDHFMRMDPYTADKETLFSLAHFADAGYFTVQRKVMLHLLERKLERKNKDAWTALNTPGRKPLEQRLAEAMLFREEHIMDLEEVIHLYETRQGADEFYVPGFVSPDEMKAFREEVAGKLKHQRNLADELDQEIGRLSVELAVN